MKLFNMQDGPDIPWELGEALHLLYEHLHPRLQDAETISNRGGFSWHEIPSMWKDRRMTNEKKQEVREMIKTYKHKVDG